MWTHNNSELLNHVLKQAIDWKSQPLLDIVNILTKIIKTQFKDLKRALVNTGEYRLCDSHKQFSVTKTAWVSKTTEERRRLDRRFRLYITKDNDVVTSTDGQTWTFFLNKCLISNHNGYSKPRAGCLCGHNFYRILS